MSRRFRDFESFYPFYLSQHRDPVCRVLHVVGVSVAASLLVGAAVTGEWRLAVAAPLCGYGLSWIGHFGFERNKPATFGYPAYSVRGDLRMTWDVLAGRLSWSAYLDEDIGAPSGLGERQDSRVE